MTPQPNQVYEANLAALAEVSPNLVKRIRISRPPRWAEAIQSPGRTPNLLIRRGVEVETAYDWQRPHEHVQAQARRVERGRTTASLIISLGLGRLIASILNRADPGHRVIAVEPDPGLWWFGLAFFDFSPAIVDGRLILTDRLIEAEALVQSQVLDRRVEAIHWEMEGPAVYRPDVYNPVADRLKQSAAAIQMGVGTLAKGGLDMAVNGVTALGWAVDAVGINELGGVCPGATAFVVATGPSLARNIHLLGLARETGLIIAVGQALRPLLAHEITPDLICSIDYGPANLVHYEGLGDVADNRGVPMVALTRTWGGVPRDYGGPKVCVCSPGPVEGEELLADKGTIAHGTSVLHLAVETAAHLGCKRIVLIGCDLALEETSHAGGVDGGGMIKIDPDGTIRWSSTDPRLDFDRTSLGPVLRVPGYWGGEVPTTLTLDQYRRQLEDQIERLSAAGARFSNSTGGGARIEGAERADLTELIQYLGDDPMCFIQMHRDRLGAIFADREADRDRAELAREAAAELQTVWKEAGRAGRVALDSLRAVEAIARREGISPESLTAGPLEKMLTWNAKLCEAAERAYFGSRALVLALDGELRRAQTAERNLPLNLDRPETLEEAFSVRIARARAVHSAAIEAAAQLGAAACWAEDALAGYPAAGEEWAELADPLGDAEDCLAVGNFARALLTAERLLRRDPDNARAGRIAIRARAMREAQIAWADEEARKRIDWLGGEGGRRLLCEEEIERAAGLVAEGKHDLAISVAQTVLDVAGKFDDRGAWPGLRLRARRLQIVAHAEAGRKDRACDLQEQLAGCRPWDRELYLQLALMLTENRQPAAGAEMLAQAIETDGTLWVWQIRLAQTEALVGQYEKSARHFKQYLAARPWDYAAWTLRGGVLAAMGRTDEAREHYRRALEIKPSHIPAIKALTNLPGLVVAAG